jgi:hypothetical protein
LLRASATTVAVISAASSAHPDRRRSRVERDVRCEGPCRSRRKSSTSG